MSEDQEPRSELAEEFKKLGRNLKDAMEDAWESEERIRVSQEIESGLKDVGEAIRQATQDLAESSTAQRMKEEVDEFAERVRSGEVADKMREELIAILNKLNAEIEKASDSWSSTEESTDSEAED